MEVDRQSSKLRSSDAAHLTPIVVEIDEQLHIGMVSCEIVLKCHTISAQRSSRARRSQPSRR
jgi:hypothetical protein